jgi:hypothetical protein
LSVIHSVHNLLSVLSWGVARDILVNIVYVVNIIYVVFLCVLYKTADFIVPCLFAFNLDGNVYKYSHSFYRPVSSIWVCGMNVALGRSML